MLEKMGTEAVKQALTVNQVNNLSESQIRTMADLGAGDRVAEVMIDKIKRTAKRKLKIADRELLVEDVEAQLSALLRTLPLAEITHREAGGKPLIEIWPEGQPKDVEYNNNGD